MVRKKIPKWCIRVSVGLCVLFVLLASICFSPAQKAYAMPGNYDVILRYHPSIEFDLINWVNRTTQYDYYLDWALNYFDNAGTNQTTEYVLGNQYFTYSTQPFVSDNTSTTAAVRSFTSRLGFGRSVIDAGAIELHASDIYIYRPELTGEYLVSFGYYGALPFAYTVSGIYDIVQPYNDEYVSKQYTFTASGVSPLVTDVTNRYALNLNDILNANIPFNDEQGCAHIQEFVIRFTQIGDPSLAVPDDGVVSVEDNTYMWVSGDLFDYGKNSTLWIGYHDLPIQEGEVIVTDFPTNWVGWLGVVLESFFDFEVFPGFSLGTLFWAILGVLMVWFLLHLFM